MLCLCYVIRKKYYLKILGLFVAVIAIALVAILLLALIAAAIFTVANNVVTRGIITGIVLVLSVIAAVLLLYPIYNIVVDDAGPIEAIKNGEVPNTQQIQKALEEGIEAVKK